MRYGIEAPSAEQSAPPANSPANSPSNSPSESSAAPALPRAPMVSTSLASDANTFDAEQAALAAKEARLLWCCCGGADPVALLLWRSCCGAVALAAKEAPIPVHVSLPAHVSPPVHVTQIGSALGSASAVDKPTPQNVVIIRHGKTEHNKLGLFTG